MPDDRMAMISELSASFEVKNMTAMNVNRGAELVGEIWQKVQKVVEYSGFERGFQE